LLSILLVLARSESDESKREELADELIVIARDKVDDPQALVEELEMAYSLDLDNVDLAEELANAYIQAGNYDRASPLVEELIERRGAKANKKERARMQHLRGQILQGAGDLAGAEEAFDQAYQTDMTYLPNLMSLGKLRYSQGELESSMKIFQTMLLHQMSLKSSRDRVDIFYHLGRIMLAKGDRRRARDMFTRALSIDRNHEPSKQGLSELE